MASVMIVTSAMLQLGAFGAAPARAGTYVLRSCDVPGHPYASLGPWAPVADSKMAVVDACATGSGIGFRFVGPHELNPTELAGVELQKPLKGPHSEINLVKVAVWYAARLRGAGQALGVYSLEPNSDQTTSWITGPPGADSLSFEQQLSPGNPAGYRVFLMCGPAQPPPSPAPCVIDSPMPLQVRGMEVTLREDVPPTVLQPAGTLVAGGAQRGVRTLSYAATDPHSGLAKVDVLLGDVVVKSHDLTSRCFYSDFTVCPASDDETLEIDTRVVPNGSYDLALRVRDAAGNERMVRVQRAIEIANEAPAESGSLRPYSVVANFKGSSRSTLTAPYGQRVLVRGRVTQGGQPVGAGIAIDVLERLDRRGARERSTRKVMTKADGSFSLGLATSRPSRAVRLAYRQAGGRQAASRTLKLRVRAASRVSASLRGRVVRFSGKVLSGPVPRNGKRVLMEGRSPGSAWTAFKVVRTNRSGQFSGAYRLRVRRPGVVLKVRAIVPSEDGYGYLSSRSRAVTLRVR